MNSGSGVTAAACICVHNEVGTIRALLDRIGIEPSFADGSWPVYVMADACTDGTLEAVTAFGRRNPNVDLRSVVHAERRGKVYCVNEFVRDADAEVLAFIDGDVQVAAGSVSALIERVMSDPSVGIACASRAHEPSGHVFLDYCENVQVEAHNRLSSVKVGRCYALRSELGGVDEELAADDTFQEWAAIRQGYKVVRVAEAVVWSRGAATVSDYLRQRRRNVAIHRLLSCRTGYSPATRKPLSALFSLSRAGSLSGGCFPSFLMLEVCSHILGQFDARFRGQDYVRWPVVHSSKGGPLQCAD